MKFTIRYTPVIATIPHLVQAMVQIHIAEAAQDVLDALPAEIERLKGLGHTEIAQKLADLQDTLQEAKRKPEP